MSKMWLATDDLRVESAYMGPAVQDITDDTDDLSDTERKREKKEGIAPPEPGLTEVCLRVTDDATCIR